jgi:hypothetical protein
MISTDMMQPHLYLTNIDTDQRIRIDLSKLALLPGGLPLHTLITADGSKAYLTVMNSDKDPLTILALRIGNLDWKNNTADVKITKVMRAGEPGEKPNMLVPTQTSESTSDRRVEARQPPASWANPASEWEIRLFHGLDRQQDSCR